MQKTLSRRAPLSPRTAAVGLPLRLPPSPRGFMLHFVVGSVSCFTGGLDFVGRRNFRSRQEGWRIQIFELDAAAAPVHCCWLIRPQLQRQQKLFRLARAMVPVCETMAAAVHSARVYVMLNFNYGASSPSRVKLPCYKCCALLKPTMVQKRYQEPSQLIQYRESIFPKSSLKELACEVHSSCPESLSSLQIDLKKQVQDHQLHQPQSLDEDVDFAGVSKKEIERRRKIGAANKGKVPWTKGRKWSEEHKKLIRQRTAEALRNPKIRKKMLGHRQLHSQESKEKISAALRKIWENRIVSVRSRRKVLQIWSNTIAEAAKEGDHSQGKLDWDSYDRIKLKMISMLPWNKEKERIIKKLKKAVAKIVAKKLQAERKKPQARGTNKTKPNAKKKKTKPDKLLLQQSDAQLPQTVVSTRPKLRERLTKWHRRKKELETVISSRKRKGELQKPPGKQRTAAWRGELNLVDKLDVR